MPQDMQARLAQANAVYQGVDENAPDGPPAATYQMQLRSSAFGESNKGNLMIRWTWVILDGEHLGKDVSDISALESEHPFPHKQLKKRMTRLGLEPCMNTWDYQEMCPQITQMAPIILGALSYRGNFQQIEIINVIQAQGTPATPAAVPVPAAPTVALPIAAPLAQTTPVPVAPAIPPAPVAAVPIANAVAKIGDTVRYVDPETNQPYDGVVDEVDAAGQAKVALNETDAFFTHVSTLTVLARAMAIAPAVPTAAPVLPVAAAPTPAPIATPAPTPALAAPAPTPDDVLRGQLLVIAKAFALEANDLSSTEELTATLSESEWVEGGDDGLNATEAATLRSVGITVAVAAPAVPAPTPPPPPPPPALTPAPAPKPKAAKKKAKKKAAKRKKQA